MVTKGELGRPVGRLREQMEKLQLHSSHRSEGKAGMLEQRLAMAEKRVRRLEGEKQAAETRAEIAERRVSTREVRSWRERNKSKLREELSTILSLFSSAKLVSFPDPPPKRMESLANIVHPHTTASCCYGFR